MSACATATASPISRKGLATSIVIVSIFMLLFLPVGFLTGSFSNLRQSLIISFCVLFLDAILFLAFFTGHVSRWRNIFFIAYALAFAVYFLWELLANRGHMWLTNREALNTGAPMCHFVPLMLYLPMFAGQGIIFPTPFYNVIPNLVAVPVLALVFGRGFCSWGCFYGGQESFFSSLAKKPLLRFRSIAPGVRLFPYAMLAFIVLTSLVTLTPIYCIWFCPFKTVTEFFEVNNLLRVLQTFIFFGIWITLVVVLPLLSKKRTQCAFFCPFGAFLSLANKINIFTVTIDREKCKDCGRCIDVCPTFSLSPESIRKGKTLATCTKCAACFSACPEGAINYGIRGMKASAQPESTRKKPGFLRRLGRELWDPGVVFILGMYYLTAFIAIGCFSGVISKLLSVVGV